MFGLPAETRRYKRHNKDTPSWIECILLVLDTKLYVCGRPWARELSSVSVQLQALYTRHCFIFVWQHKFSIKALLCNPQCFYVADSDVLAQQHPQNALLCFHCNSGYANPPQCYVTRTWLILFLLYTTQRVVRCCCDNGESCNKCNWQKDYCVCNKSYRLL